jgi:hypothetical protein
MPKSSQKKGGAKKEYTGTYRHFTLHEVNGKEVEIGTATIKDYQTPLNAAKKLLSSYCRHEGIKSNERNKVNITFTIRETTRGHSKIYGPYKGKFVKYDKPVMIKLKSGKVIKRTVKPMVKLAKGNNNKKMVGGQSSKIIVRDKAHLKELINNLDINFSDLDVSNITDMSTLFSNFNFSNRTGNSDISNWDVSNVINMEYMFRNSEGFNQDLSKWNEKLRIVNSMNGMFKDCKDFNKGLNWNISYKTSIEHIFSGCDKLIYEKTTINRFTNDETTDELLKNSINLYIYNRNGCSITRLENPYGSYKEDSLNNPKTCLMPKNKFKLVRSVR